MTPNLDFKVTTFFNIKFKNGTRHSHTYNGRLTGPYMIHQVVPFSMTVNDP